MTNYNWDESEHPRDNEGKFTFKNGGASGSDYEKRKQENQKIADILYPTMKDKGDLVQNNPNIKLYLNTRLGGDVLKYDSEQGTLTGGAVEYKDNYNNHSENTGINDKVKQVFYELGLNQTYETCGYSVASLVFGPDTVGMVDLAHKNPKNPEYAKNAIKYKSYDDQNLKRDKEYFEIKLSKEYKDYGYDIKNISGYEFKSDSGPSQRILNDPDFIKSIKDNKENILNGDEASGYFPRYSDYKKSNLHYAIGHYDLRHGHLDNNGNLHIKVYDTYDFNKTNSTPLNQAGRSQMMKGNLIPYFTIHDIIIPKSTIDKIW